MKLRGIELRKLVLGHYSNGQPKCACCTETQYEFLCLDHVNGGGKAQRRTIGLSGRSVYAWVVKNQYPEGFRVLCYNCNFSIGAHGVCAHVVDCS